MRYRYNPERACVECFSEWLNLEPKWFMSALHETLNSVKASGYKPVSYKDTWCEPSEDWVNDSSRND